MSFKLLSHLRKRANFFTFGLGLCAGFVIRDETEVPNLQLVDELILEYEAKDRTLSKQAKEVDERLQQLGSGRINPQTR